MPLCERLRLDAGRSFTQTLLVRVYVAMVLLLLVTVITNKQHLNLDKADFIFGSNAIKPSTMVSDVDTKLTQLYLNNSNGIGCDIKDIFAPTARTIIASNDTYGR